MIKAKYTAAITDKPWWLAGGIPPSACVAAYQAVGASSLAASYKNLANPNNYNLTEVDGFSPGWDSINGWIFTDAKARRLNTNIVINSVNWSFIIKFNGMTVDDRHLCGVWTDGHMSGIRNRFGKHDWANFSNDFTTSFSITLADAASGVSAVAGRNGYWNGINKVKNIPTDTVASQSFYLGGRNFLSSSVTANEQCFAIYNAILSDNQVAALTNAMNAL